MEPFGSQEVHLEEFLRRGYAGSMEYLARRDDDGRLERFDVRKVFAEASSILSVALPYKPPSPPVSPEEGVPDTAPQGRIAAYALGADYHFVIKEKLLLLADWIADSVGQSVVARACVDTAPLLERDLAVRAGYAFIGKNTLAIAPGAGSHFLLGELLLDIALEPAVGPIAEGCGSCRLCLDHCPTDAFVEPYLLDGRRCLSYLTIESREDIPEQLRSLVGSHIFGCDICQSSCPFNRGRRPRPVAPELETLGRLEAPQLIELLSIGSSAYRRLVAKTALRRVSRHQFVRNVAVALGNSASHLAIAPLRKVASGHISPQVRSHSAWALEQLHTVHGLKAAGRALAEVEQLASS